MPHLISGKPTYLYLLNDNRIQSLIHELETEIDWNIKTWRPIGAVEFYLEKRDENIIVPIFLYFDKIIDSEREYIKRLTFGTSPSYRTAADILIEHHLKGCKKSAIHEERCFSLVDIVDEYGITTFRPLQEVRIEECFNEKTGEVRKSCHLYSSVYKSSDKIHIISI